VLHEIDRPLQLLGHASAIPIAFRFGPLLLPSDRLAHHFLIHYETDFGKELVRLCRLFCGDFSAGV